jgi:hypothetical protein
MKTRTRIVVLLIVALAILLCVFLMRATSIQYTGEQPVESSAVWRHDGYETIQTDRGISWMVARARVDHFIAPIEGLGGHIVFEEARGNGDDVYLLFRPSNVSDCIILYRGRRKDGKLLSKMVLGFDA